MKNIFKLSLSLLGNQALGFVGSTMCVIFVNLIAGQTLFAHLIFLAINFSFFMYIEDRAAFMSGFHDPNRRNAPDSKKYLFKGFIAGVISLIPLLVLFGFYIYFYSIGHSPWVKLLTIYIRTVSMYYVHPMLNIIPNHALFVMITAVIIPMIIPTIGYIAGYKNYEWTYEILKIKTKKSNEMKKNQVLQEF